MADITVQVSSPGSLTTWGQGTFGSSGFGGSNVLESSTGTSDAYNMEGWGRLSWGSLVWGEDFVNATVFVTTPATPTTWGQSSFGNYAWGELIGSQIDIGEESITTELNAIAIASTNLLNLSIASVLITGDANLTLSTNLLQVSLGDEGSSADVLITLTTLNELNTTIGAYSITADGNTSEIVVGDSMNSTTGTLTADAGASFEVSGNSLNIVIGDEALIGNATVNLSTNLLNVTTGTASGDVATLVLTGVSATISTGTVSFTIDGSVLLTSVNMTASTGRLFVSAWAVINIGVSNTWSVVDIAA